jgi:hypothetical protein
VIGIASALLGAWLWGRAGLVAAAAGAALAVANLWVLRRLVDRAFAEAAAGGGETATQRLLVRFLLKMPVLFGLVYLAIAVLGLEPAPFALGLSTLVLAFVMGGLWAGLRRPD